MPRYAAFFCRSGAGDRADVPPTGDVEPTLTGSSNRAGRPWRSQSRHRRWWRSHCRSLQGASGRCRGWRTRRVGNRRHCAHCRCDAVQPAFTDATNSRDHGGSYLAGCVCFMARSGRAQPCCGYGVGFADFSCQRCVSQFWFAPLDRRDLPVTSRSVGTNSSRLRYVRGRLGICSVHRHAEGCGHSYGVGV